RRARGAQKAGIAFEVPVHPLAVKPHYPQPWHCLLQWIPDRFSQGIEIVDELIKLIPGASERILSPGEWHGAQEPGELQADADPHQLSRQSVSHRSPPFSRLLKKEFSCFDRLSTNGKSPTTSSLPPFALS